MIVDAKISYMKLLLFHEWKELFVEGTYTVDYGAYVGGLFLSLISSQVLKNIPPSYCSLKVCPDVNVGSSI